MKILSIDKVIPFINNIKYDKPNRFLLVKLWLKEFFDVF